MPRYLTFDEKTASTLRDQVPEHKVFEHGADDALDYALGTDRNLVAVMPGGAARQAAVAVFRKRKTSAQAAPSVEVRRSVLPERKPLVEERTPFIDARNPVASVVPLRENRAFRTSGFLGLSDESLFEEEQPAVSKKQSWWRKLWPEDE